MKMIDVGEKEVTSRIAIARAELKCGRAALKLLNEGRLEKGDALAAARLAGIMAAKHTPHFLPLCHAISIAGADVDVRRTRRPAWCASRRACTPSSGPGWRWRR